MPGTNDQRGRRRAEKWLSRSGGFSYVPPEAFNLLVLRLAARRKARLTCAPLFAFGLCIFLSLPFEGPALGSPTWGRAFAERMLATYAVLAVAGLLADTLAHRAERRIGQTLPSRISRGTAISLRMMLGKSRLTYLVFTIVVDAALAVTLLVAHPGWLAWTFLAALIVACGFVTLGLRQAAGRATNALEPISLAIDERLRAEEAYQSVYWLSVLLIAFPAGSQSGPAWLHLAWIAALVITLPGQLSAATSRPWKSERPLLLPSATVPDHQDPWAKL